MKRYLRYGLASFVLFAAFLAPQARAGQPVQAVEECYKVLTNYYGATFDVYATGKGLNLGLSSSASAFSNCCANVDYILLHSFGVANTATTLYCYPQAQLVRW